MGFPRWFDLTIFALGFAVCGIGLLCAILHPILWHLAVRHDIRNGCYTEAERPRFRW